MNPQVSVLIPARGEGPVLQRTVADIYEKATGEIEVLVGFDGPPYQQLYPYPNLHQWSLPETIGLKALINKLAQAATGKYILKTDAHCMFALGFDETLAADMQDNWVVTPRFYVLDAARWAWQDVRFYDYFYLSCPFTDPKGFRFKAGGHWPERTRERLHSHPHIDETPQMHGTAWFINREYYLEHLRFPEWDPFGHAQEPPWLGLNSWLSGGALMVNKKVWYAHWHQQGNKRGYHMSKAQENLSYRLHAEYWLAHPQFEKFVERFPDMPTWPADWRQRLDLWKLQR